MSNQRDKTSIFLTVVIIFLIVAMAVYGFIYRDKIGETLQKFTKKNSTIEKHEIRTESRKPKNEFSELAVESEPKESEKFLVPENIPKKEERNLEFLEPDKKPVKKTETGPTISEPDHKYLDPTESPGFLEKKETSKAKKTEIQPKLPPGYDSGDDSENLTTVKKSAKLKKGKRSKKGKASLERRVRKLERKLGLKPKKGGSLSKRVTRLEKIVSKRKK